MNMFLEGLLIYLASSLIIMGIGFLPGLFMLQIEDGLLCLYLPSEFFLRGQVELILCGKKLLAAMHNGIAGDILIRFGTQHNAKRGVVAFGAFLFVIHPDIHIHLPHVLMGDSAGFQVDQHKTLENVVVKDEIDIK